MPKSSAVTCKLNSNFKKALKSKRFDRGIHERAGAYYAYHEEGVRDKKHDIVISPNAPGMSCCGLDELDLQPLMHKWDLYKNETDEVIMELVARYIRESIINKDRRVLIVGLPIKVGQHSMYNVNFYQKMRTILGKIGFVEVGKPYKNQNSSNTIVAMVGQLPR